MYFLTHLSSDIRLIIVKLLFACSFWGVLILSLSRLIKQLSGVPWVLFKWKIVETNNFSFIIWQSKWFGIIQRPIFIRIGKDLLWIHFMTTEKNWNFFDFTKFWMIKKLEILFLSHEYLKDQAWIRFLFYDLTYANFSSPAPKPIAPSQALWEICRVFPFEYFSVFESHLIPSFSLWLGLKEYWIEVALDRFSGEYLKVSIFTSKTLRRICVQLTKST